MAQTNEDIALRKYVKDTVGDNLTHIRQNQESIYKSITSLTMEIGNIKFPGFPGDYSRKPDLDNLRKELALDKLCIKCELSEKDSGKIDKTYQALIDAKESYDRLAEERKKKRINIQLNLPAKVLGVLLILMGLCLGICFYQLYNLPEYLAHEFYEIKSQMDYASPGLYYEQALTKARAGNVEDVKNDIKHARTALKELNAYESILQPLLDNRPMCVRDIEYELDTHCALVKYRFKDNDILWKAFFLEDGSIMITDSDFVKTPYDARKMLTSKMVKWEKIR